MINLLNILPLAVVSGVGTFLMGISAWNVYSCLKWAHSWREKA